jgi:O-antigen/teichoic acid export membrane protein
MLSPSKTVILLSLLVGLGVVAICLTIALLRRGKLYYRLSPEKRPRRWVLISLLLLMAILIVWFPMWITWPNALVSRFLLVLFGISFCTFSLTYKWLSPLVDAYFKRKGWQLR